MLYIDIQKGEFRKAYSEAREALWRDQYNLARTRDQRIRNNLLDDIEYLKRMLKWLEEKILNEK